LNRGKHEIYLGSTNLMQRNLNHRVKTVFPVEDPEYVEYLQNYVLATYFRDQCHTRVMQSDGSYKRLHQKEGDAGSTGVVDGQPVEKEGAGLDFGVDPA
jgi:polyphosphate kinase